MRFVITSEGNNSTFGDLFFSLPTEEASAHGAELVEQLCRQEDLPTQAHADRLEEELQRMRESQTAYHFLLMKEIKELSPGGIVLHSCASASIICKLLGLSAIDALCPDLVENHLSTPVEFIWGLPGSGQLPILEAAIAPEIRTQIHHRLDRQYGRVDTNDDLFRQITLMDQYKPTLRNTAAQCTPELCLKVLHTIAQEEAECTQRHFDERAIEKTEFHSRMNLAEEMQAMTFCDLPTLIHLYAYGVGNFEDKRQVGRLQDPWFFTTREEFYAMLLTLGMPKEEALEMISRGVRSRGERRARFMERLIQYNAPQELIDNFSKTTNLWSAAACLSRIHFLLQTI